MSLICGLLLKTTWCSCRLHGVWYALLVARRVFMLLPSLGSVCRRDCSPLLGLWTSAESSMKFAAAVNVQSRQFARRARPGLRATLESFQGRRKGEEQSTIGMIAVL